MIDRSVVLLADLREALRSRFGEDIRDSAATIVGALLSESGGFLIHVGDGIASSFTIGTRDAALRMSVAVQSNPDNGEFINETSYITDPDWLRHVRITPLADIDCLILCTDGAQSLFYESNRPFGGALIPLLKILANAKTDGKHFLEEMLASTRAASISSDDKTIAIVARSRFLEDTLALCGTDIECSEQILGRFEPEAGAKISDRPVGENSIASGIALASQRLSIKGLPWYRIAAVGLIVIAGMIFGAPHLQTYVCPVAASTDEPSEVPN